MSTLIVRISSPAVLILLVGCYITLGLVEELLLVRKARRERKLAARSAAEPAAPQSPVVESADDEREVLAELGVDDEPARPEA